jgi:sarcosine oxidase delta subunit
MASHGHDPPYTFHQDKAAQSIQRAWRGYHLQVCVYLPHKASRTVQAKYCGYLLQSAYCRYKEAILTKAAFCGYSVLLLKCRYGTEAETTIPASRHEYVMWLALRRYQDSARILQRAWSTYFYCRCKAAQVIQSAWRHYICWHADRLHVVQKDARTIQVAWRRYIAMKKIRTIWHEFVLLLAYRRYKEMRRQKDLPPFFHQDHAARSIQGAWRGYYIRLTLDRNQSVERIPKHPSKRSVAAKKIQLAWRSYYFGRWCQSLLVAVNDSQQQPSCREWNGTLSLHLLRDMAFDLSFEDDTSISTLSASGKVHVDVSLDSASVEDGQNMQTWDVDKKFSLSVILAFMVPSLLYSSARR